MDWTRRVWWLGIVACCACGGSSGSGADDGPSGLTMAIGTTPIEDGAVLAPWSGVPVRQVRWPDTVGQGVASHFGHVQVEYMVTNAMADVEARFESELVGDVAAFTVDTLGLIGGGGRVIATCTPPGAGTYHAELRGRIADSPGWAQLHLTCEAVDDYAMFPGTIRASFGPTTAGLLLSTAERYDTQAREWMPVTSTGDREAPPFLLGVTDDGNTALRAMFDASSDPHGFYLWDIPSNTSTPALTKAEATEHLDWMGAHSAALSADGNTGAFATFRSGVFVKDFTSGKLTRAPGAGDGTWGLELFGVTAAGEEVLFGRATPALGHLDVDALWSFDGTAGVTKPLLGPGVRSALADLDWINQVKFDTAARRVLVGSAYYGTFRGHRVDRDTDTVAPVLEGILAHADEREGPAPKSIPVPTMTSLSRSGRYVGAVLNRWNDGEYWSGTRFVFVEDLETDELFSVGFLPDGTKLSGDGWLVESAVVRDDGQSVAFSTSWRNGQKGEIFGPFTLVIPRRMWVPVKR